MVVGSIRFWGREVSRELFFFFFFTKDIGYRCVSALIQLCTRKVLGIHAILFVVIALLLLLLLYCIELNI
jgi:hypothetical protein